MAHRCTRRIKGRCVSRAHRPAGSKRRRGLIILARVTEQGNRRITEDGQFRDIEG